MELDAKWVCDTDSREVLITYFFLNPIELYILRIILLISSHRGINRGFDTHFLFTNTGNNDDDIMPGDDSSLTQ